MDTCIVMGPRGRGIKNCPMHIRAIPIAFMVPAFAAYDDYG